MPTLRLYRVFLWKEGARRRGPGHPLHVPRHLQGGGRLDDPSLYSVLYASDSPAGAVAEAFGPLPVWTTEMFSSPRGANGVRALVTYKTTTPAILDLDDPERLAERTLRPSRVVTRDRRVSQAWARSAHEEQRWTGVRWWSYFDSRWYSYGLWDITRLRVHGTVEPLHATHPAVLEAADVLERTWSEA